MLNKKECIEALNYLASGQCSYCWKSGNEEVLVYEDAKKMLTQLINEHFELVHKAKAEKHMNNFMKTLDKIILRESYFGHILKAIMNCENDELQDNAISSLSILKSELDNLPFKLQLTRYECELIVDGLKLWEEELGWDVTLLIEKIEEYKSLLPKGEGVVECVEID